MCPTIFQFTFPQLSSGFCSCQFWLYFENMFEVFFLFCHSTVICPKKSKMILAISRWKVNSYLLSNMDIYRLHPPCCYLVVYLLNCLTPSSIARAKVNKKYWGEILKCFFLVHSFMADRSDKWRPAELYRRYVFRVHTIYWVCA